MEVKMDGICFSVPRACNGKASRSACWWSCLPLELFLPALLEVSLVINRQGRGWGVRANKPEWTFE